MKRILIGILVIFLISCGNEEKQIERIDSRINKRRAELANIEEEIRVANNLKKIGLDGELMVLRGDIQIAQTALENLKQLQVLEHDRIGDAIYMLQLEIKQSTFTLDIGEHIKNSANAIKLWIPTSKEFYNSISIGSEISDSFKFGSFIFDGDFSNLHVKVIDKKMGAK
jgi:DNA polymerase III delta prime subunit